MARIRGTIFAKAGGIDPARIDTQTGQFFAQSQGERRIRLSYTLEAPSDYLLPTRIHALAAGAQTILDNV